MKGLVILLTGVLIGGCVIAQDCLDYGDHNRWVGAADTPDEAYSVVISGNHTYIASSHIMDGPVYMQIPY